VNRRCLLTLVAVSGFNLAWARASLASITFPDVVATEWGIETPECTLCHSRSVGTSGTATKPFAQSLVLLFGAQATNKGALRSALAQDKQTSNDSDGDFVSDYDELVQDHTDPNDRNSFKMEPPSTGGSPGTASGGSVAMPDPGDAGAPTGEGGTAGAEASSGGMPESPAQCRTTRIYPTPSYGCAMRVHPGTDGEFFALLIFPALALLRRRPRPASSP
jgi:hypothetical protein